MSGFLPGKVLYPNGLEMISIPAGAGQTAGFRTRMNLEPPDTHYLRAACGWLELGNPAEAGEEIARSRAEVGSGLGNRRNPRASRTRKTRRLAASGLRLAPSQKWRLATGLGSAATGFRQVSRGRAHRLQSFLLRRPVWPLTRSLGMAPQSRGRLQ